MTATHEVMLMDRVKTGIEGLDQLLLGGFLRGDAIVVGGSPGTGKTSLGMQFLYNGVTRYREPGLFVTFEEFPQRIYRDAQGFGWDFRRLEQEGKLKVLFTSPEVLQQDVVRDNGLVAEMIRETGARRVVVDSISHFHEIADSPRQFRQAVYGLVNALKREALTCLLTRELAEGEELGSGPEEFVADALIMLSRAYVGGHSMRFLEIKKSRGSGHIAIPSLFSVSASGLRVIPPFQEPLWRFEEAVSTGHKQLDDLLGGGIPYGSFYLMEIDGELHQDLLDVGFAREALEAGDRYARVAGQSDPRHRWWDLMKRAGLEPNLQERLAAGDVVLVWPGGPEAPAISLSPEVFASETSALCRGQGDCPLRVQVDISRLLAMMSGDQGCAALLGLISRCRSCSAVVVGAVGPRAVAPGDLERLRAAADGIVRIWTEGSYSYLQVVKTVNSARTPVHVVTQTSEPPFLEIILQ